jgi:hypothetical protein
MLLLWSSSVRISLTTRDASPHTTTTTAAAVVTGEGLLVPLLLRSERAEKDCSSRW